MVALLLSIGCSVSVSVFLKLAKRHGIDVAQAIAFNYVMASTLCVVLLRPALPSRVPDRAWILFLALGVLLPTVFLVMARAVRETGIVLSDAAQRLSLFLPLLAAVVVFGERLDGQKLAGIGLALVALGCLLVKPVGATPGARSILLLAGVWVGYGLIDILFKQLAKSGAAFGGTLLVTFIIAGVLLFAWLLTQGARWGLRHALAGLLLGSLNFGNIYFYIRAHQVFEDSPTIVFAAMNIGVISLGTMVGAGLFGERPSRTNYGGVGLAIFAIWVLLPK